MLIPRIHGSRYIAFGVPMSLMVWDGPRVLSYDHVLFSTASAVPSAAVALCGRPLLYVMQCYPHDDILWDTSCGYLVPDPPIPSHGIWSPCSCSVRIAKQLRTACPLCRAMRSTCCATAAHHTSLLVGTQDMVLGPHSIWIPRYSGSMDPRPLSIWYLETLGIMIPGPLRSMTSG